MVSPLSSHWLPLFIQNIQCPEPSVAQDETYVDDDPEPMDDEPQELSQNIKEKFGHLFLKLESFQCTK